LDLRDFNPDARDANLWNRQQLGPEDLGYLKSLNETLVEDGFTLTHGSPRYPIWEYVIYASTAQINFKHFATRYCFVGHTHTPMSFRWNSQGNNASCEIISPVLNSQMELGEERWIINPGSVGQPRDGDPRASYLLLDTETRIFEHRRVGYDIERTQAKMMEHDLPLRLVLRLGYGW
jgi:diadenosine tetraphosphatase ApaH/serine/threonine PP2A family protein phosphatase